MLRPLRILSIVLLLLGSCGKSSLQEGRARTIVQYKGSDTLVNVAQEWSARYNELHPQVAVAVFGGGTGTGISALINGTADLANASRQMTEDERRQCRANGIEPVEHLVGYGAVAVFAHLDNPIEMVTIEQLAGIYGQGGAIETWSQLGFTVPGCGSDQIVRVSRQNSSGTYAYFRRAILGEHGDYKIGAHEMHASKDVVELVSRTPCAIGYAGFAYARRNVKVVPVASTPSSPAVMPSVDTIIDDSYPITRPLFLYTAGEPQGQVKSFVDWILGAEGQRILLDHGYASRERGR